jgi:hypothetical protein
MISWIDFVGLADKNRDKSSQRIICSATFARSTCVSHLDMVLLYRLNEAGGYSFDYVFLLPIKCTWSAVLTAFNIQR